MIQLIYVAVCMCVAVAISVSAWLLAPFSVGHPDPAGSPPAKHARGMPPTQTPNPQVQEAKTPTPAQHPKFDVVRLDPQGASVFAGRASANQRVTILMNGREFASAQADDDGQWAVVVERPIPSGEVELALIASGPESGRSDRGQA
jgi:hypothetical protein